MTMLVRDEGDVLDAQLRFHLAVGVDFVIVTDHRSVDSTREILRVYEREGVARVIEEQSEEYRPSEWRTRMARLAATEHGADWVFSADADEFWWPRGASLRDVFAKIPSPYGIVQGVLRHFVPVPDSEGPFYERLVYRLSPQAPINDPTSPWRPVRKLAHRASTTITVGPGNHTVDSTSLRTLRGWYPIEVLHFPIRSGAQLERKGAARSAAAEKFFSESFQAAAPGTAYHAVAYAAASEGTIDELLGSLGVDASDVPDAIERGILTEDRRLRDVLRVVEGMSVAEANRAQLELPQPSVVDEALFAADAAVLGEADMIRARRTLDDIDARLAAVESSLPVRLERSLRSVVRRLLRRARPGAPDS